MNNIVVQCNTVYKVFLKILLKLFQLVANECILYRGVPRRFCIGKSTIDQLSIIEQIIKKKGTNFEKNI